jgi:aspartate/methionine/tyrosine aminotransferase
VEPGLRHAELIDVVRQVIVFDPQYDSYACMTRRAGGVVKLVKLNDSDWSVPRDEFRSAFGPRTKMVLVNTPHNPTGTYRKLTCLA